MRPDGAKSAVVMLGGARVRFLLVVLGIVAVMAWHSQAVRRDSANVPAISAFGRLPLPFIANAGQEPADVAFTVDDGPMEILFDRLGYTVDLQTDRGASRVHIAFEGADTAARVVVAERAEGVANFYRGDDPAFWFEAVPMANAIRYVRPWPGIDVEFDGRQGAIESIYHIAPAADPHAIHLRYEGDSAPFVDREGRLVTQLATGHLVESAPVAYQVIDGARVDVEAAFAVEGSAVRFKVGRYDRAWPLIIDPTLLYSTYLGGSGSDQANAIALDPAGNAYITGFTSSTNFPTASPSQAGNGGGRDVFVTKLNATGSALVYSTYLGGLDDDQGNGIAVDGSGSAYITGSTFSTNFPTMTPLQLTNGGGEDAIAFKLTAAGALSYSTYYGGTDDDRGKGIAQNAGAAFIIGKTTSTDLTLATPYQAAIHGLSDAFALKLTTTGSALSYATYLGGLADEDGRAIAVDVSGNAYLTGSTSSPTFPTVGPLQPALAGPSDAFVSKLTPTGTALAYSTFMGGGAKDDGYGITVDTSGNAYVTGLTSSTDFPTVGPYQPANAGTDDAFVAKINSTGSALTYATYLGGTGGDAGAAISVDSSGAAHVTGSTFSTDFPLMAAFQPTHIGATADAFVTKFTAPGNALTYSSYLGGSGSDRGWGIVADNANKAYIAGSTQSSNFPPVASFQSGYGGLGDAFAAKVDGTIGPDADGDGVPDASDNCPAVPNPLQENTDRNYVDQTPPSTQDDRTVPNSDPNGDACDADDDNDGLADSTETAGAPCASASAATNPTDADTDGDRFLDGAECALIRNPASASSKPALADCAATGDADGDRLQNRVEVCHYNTDPNDSDTDGDQDGWPTTGLAKDGCEAGSLNSDRVVNAADQLLLAGAILTPFYLWSFDLTKDGGINAGDQLMMAQLIVPGGQCP